MLPLPETEVRRSIGAHNCDLQLFCDWIEGCLLFKKNKNISRADIIDIICEEDIYDDQGFASDWLDNVWTELLRRQVLLGRSAPYKVSARVISMLRSWKQVPAYAFCVLAPLLQATKAWAKNINHQRQGELFEQISEEAIQAAGWSTFRTAWSQNSAAKLPTVVKRIAQELGEPEHHDWQRNVAANQNEAGLDVVFYRKFADKRCGFVVYLAQCATGENWSTKLHTPALEAWSKLIDFSSPPQKAFALPHSLDDDKLRRTTVSVGGIVLDRYRLFESRRTRWCSQKLETELKSYLDPLIRGLPTLA
jgi:hypothetical protein